MTIDITTISVLEGAKITRDDIIAYLELMKSDNLKILRVLKKKPALPEYRELQWFLDFKFDQRIAKKLRQKKLLTNEEKIHLKNTLQEAVLQLKKWRRVHHTDRYCGLEQYIEKNLIISVV